MALVYVIFSEKFGKRYVGSTRADNSVRRLRSHNVGKVRSTKAGRPWKILLEEKFDNYTLARKREIFLKSGQGRKWLDENILNNHGAKVT